MANAIYCNYIEGGYGKTVIKVRKIKGHDIVFKSSIHIPDDPDFEGRKKEFFTMEIVDNSGLVFDEFRALNFDRETYRNKVIRDKDGESYAIVIVNNDK